MCTDVSVCALGAAGCIVSVHQSVVELFGSEEVVEMPVMVKRMEKQITMMEELKALEDEFQTQLSPVSAHLERGKEKLEIARSNVTCCRDILREVLFGLLSNAEINEETISQLTSSAEISVSCFHIYHNSGF